MKKKNNLAQPIAKTDITELKEFLDKKFTNIDKRFSSIDERFFDIDKRFSGMEKRFDNLENRFDGLEGRFDGLEHRFDNMETRMEEGFTELKTDLRATEKRLNGRITHVGDLITIELGQKHQKLKKRITSLEHTLHAA